MGLVYLIDVRKREEPMRIIRAKFAGNCVDCGKRLEKGEKVYWEKGVGISCVDCEEDDDSPEAREYRRGQADAERYSAEKKIYGEELGEAFAAMDEMNRFWKYGEEY
jgi:hypothetical protein